EGDPIDDDLLSTKSQVDQSLLFHLMRLSRTRRRACARRTLHAQHRTLSSHAPQLRDHEGEGAHVGRLFLHPYDLLCVRMLVQCGLQLSPRPWIQLLDEDDADAHVLALLALDSQVVP